MSSLHPATTSAISSSSSFICWSAPISGRRIDLSLSNAGLPAVCRVYGKFIDGGFTKGRSSHHIGCLELNSSVPQSPLEVCLDSAQGPEAEFKQAVGLLELERDNRGFVGRGVVTVAVSESSSRPRHFLGKDLEDIVYIPDEVKEDDGFPEQALFGPFSAGVRQLKICGKEVRAGTWW